MIAVYFLLLLSGFLFALEFCVEKQFQRFKPNGETSTVLFSLLGKVSAIAVFAILLAFGGDAFWGTPYTVLVGIARALISLLIAVVAFRLFGIGSVALYTVFLMIGGMAVPVAVQAFLPGFSFGWTRILAFVMIAVGVVLSVNGEGKKVTAKALLLYFVVFLANGLAGVFTVLHTQIWSPGVSSLTFSFATNVVSLVVYLPAVTALFFVERKKGMLPVVTAPFPNGLQKFLFYASPFAAGILNGIANYLVVIGTATESMSAATYPMTTGGTILFTAILSFLFYREKLSAKKIVSALLIVAALVVFIL